MNTMRIFKILFLLLFPIALFAQDAKLAQQYFGNGEYEKASTLYQKLYKSNNNNDHYFNKYIECLINLEQYSACEEIIKKQIKKNQKQVQLYVTYGNLYERQYMDELANEQYTKAIKKLTADKYSITKLANAFKNLTKFDLAIETYEKGAKLLKDENVFAYNLGDLYRHKGDIPKMINSYILSMSTDDPSRINQMKTMFQRHLHSEEDYMELQTQLYNKIQEDENATRYPELLTWVFIQRKDYKNALRQVKALDRKLGENGGRIYKLAGIAANDKDYETAIESYDYVVNDKGPSSGFYIDSKRESLSCKRKKVVEGFSFDREELLELEGQYATFLQEFGKTKETATIVAELADLEAFYLNDFDKAITLLAEMIEYPGINRIVKAKGKLSLADFYLMKGEIWEATLLYSQVDKEFKDDPLGHEARYRNAKLSYFAADFQWAQTQFDILKASTSKLIANDALDLSIFIMDNMGLDTTTTALELYSESDLLIFQNRFEDAFKKLDTLSRDFPQHTLKDDIYYSKAQIYTKKRDYNKAIDMYNKIIAEHNEEIRCDNAIFEMANLYEKQLDQPEKAKELYETLFTEYSSSTFAIDARKRYRKLRGDDIQ